MRNLMKQSNYKGPRGQGYRVFVTAFIKQVTAEQVMHRCVWPSIMHQSDE